MNKPQKKRPQHRNYRGVLGKPNSVAGGNRLAVSRVCNRWVVQRTLGHITDCSSKHFRKKPRERSLPVYAASKQNPLD